MNLDDFIEQGDAGDIALAWDRAMASTAREVSLTPGATYKTARPLVIGRRVAIDGCEANVVATATTGIFVAYGARNPEIHALNVLSNGAKTLKHHGFHFESAAIVSRCWAKAAGGDGFHVSADLSRTPPSNANAGEMHGCLASACGGRGYSWRGGDSNAWLVVKCSASDNAGDYECLESCASWAGGPCGCYRGSTGLVGGFHDHSFLGNHFVGCDTGNLGIGSLAFALDGDSSSGSMHGCYVESSNKVLVRRGNVCIGGNADFAPGSDGFAMRGSRVSGRAVFGNAAAGPVDATIELGGPSGLDGSFAEMRTAVDRYGYSIRRMASGGLNGWTGLMRGNQAAQAVLAWRGDGNAGAPPEVWAPLGIKVGPTQRLVDAAWFDSVTARLAALEAKP